MCEGIYYLAISDHDTTGLYWRYKVKAKEEFSLLKVKN